MTIGRCIKPHGLTGEVRVRPITDFPERFEQTEYVFAHRQCDPVKRLALEAVRAHSSGFLVSFRGVDSVEKAEQLRGYYLAVPEDELVILEDDEYWHWELEGLRAFDPQGRPIGVLKEVLESAAHDLYVIKDVDGKEHLVPAVHQYVPEISIAEDRIVVILPELEE